MPILNKGIQKKNNFENREADESWSFKRVRQKESWTELSLLYHVPWLLAEDFQSHLHCFGIKRRKK